MQVDRGLGQLEGKVALVTGGSRGIGKAIARKFLNEGASVMLTSRKLEALESAAKELGGPVEVCAANAGALDDAERCVGLTLEKFGAIDVLVNNAATNPYFGPSIDIDVARYDKTFAVNTRAPFFWSKFVWKAYMELNGGCILNVASLGGFVTERRIGIYNASKAALLYLTKVMALEMGPQVRVNAIAPALVKTEMARALWEPHEEDIARSYPLRRLGVPEDIAKAAVFLVSEQASWITGEALIVDGGSNVRPR